jgi:G patch domain-containing protein 2
MDCENMNDNFLSSSSLSSSESETEDTNGSDHEGDDELTDWPGHEAMVNFSRNDLRNVKRCSKLKKIKQDEVLQDDETLMSAEEVQFPLKSPSTLMLQSNSSSNPIDINNLVDTTSQFAQDGSSTSGINADYGSFNFPRVIESEMSGETSNSLLSSCIANEIREIRAGCRRIRDERPGFSIIASFNDELMR